MILLAYVSVQQEQEKHLLEPPTLTNENFRFVASEMFHKAS